MPERVVRRTDVVRPAVPRPPEKTIPRPLTAGEQLASQLRDALATAQSSLNNSLQIESQQAENTAEALKSEDLKKEAEKNPEIKKSLQSVEELARARIEHLTSTADARTKGLTQLQGDLEQLIAELLIMRRQM